MPQDPSKNPEEIARAQQELRDAEVFAQVLERRQTPSTDSPRLHTVETTAGGMLGFLIRKKLARDEVQANYLLLTLAVIMIGVSIFLLKPFNISAIHKSSEPLGPPKITSGSAAQQ